MEDNRYYVNDPDEDEDDINSIEIFEETFNKDFDEIDFDGTVESDSDEDLEEHYGF